MHDESDNVAVDTVTEIGGKNVAVNNLLCMKKRFVTADPLGRRRPEPHPSKPSRLHDQGVGEPAGDRLVSAAVVRDDDVCRVRTAQ